MLIQFYKEPLFVVGWSVCDVATCELERRGKFYNNPQKQSDDNIFTLAVKVFPFQLPVGPTLKTDTDYKPTTT